jgi:hypothetical protein
MLSGGHSGIRLRFRGSKFEASVTTVRRVSSIQNHDQNTLHKVNKENESIRIGIPRSENPSQHDTPITTRTARSSMMITTNLNEYSLYILFNAQTA